MKFIKLLVVLIFSCFVLGCEPSSKEKTFDHYMQHPEELEIDFNYCAQFPQAGMCANTMKHYSNYQKYRNDVDNGNSKVLRKNGTNIWLSIDSNWDNLANNQ